MNLQLSLKKNWFEMTKSGEKTEDYREITSYWCSRLLEPTEKVIFNWKGFFETEDSPKVMTRVFFHAGWLRFKPFINNTMTLGYPQSSDTDRILKLNHKGIEIRTGNPEWGAEPDKLYFVIKHGKYLNQ